MINVTSEPIPPERAKKLREWLQHEQSLALRNSVSAAIAMLQAEVTNESLKKPQIVIREGLNPEDETIRSAARLQIFLDVLNQLSDPDHAFITVKLTPG